MDRSNTYHGQVVTEAELDQMFDYAEDAERDIARESGISQADAADSPGPLAYGGIADGFVVTATPGDTSVSISDGVARDQLGRRIVMGALTRGRGVGAVSETTRVTQPAGPATVLISHTGVTDEGDVSAAQGNGAAITGSCPASDYIIASLFIVYDEDLSYARTDASGTTIQYTITETFHFNITIFTAFTPPPSSTPGRAALADSNVLLADILLTNNGGTMQVVAVCNTSADWDALGAYYEDLVGRRSDVIALDADDFALATAEGLAIRGGSAREGLYLLAKQLMNATDAANDPDGVRLIGSDAITGAVALDLHEPFNLTSGSLRAALLAITNELGAKVSRGGDLSQAFYDDFMYPPTGASESITPSTDMYPNWSEAYTGTPGGAYRAPPNDPGGVLQIISTGAALVSKSLITAGWWSLTATPYAQLRVRLRIPTLHADNAYTIGFSSVAGSATCDILITGSDGTCKARHQDTTGVFAVYSASAAIITANVWTTIDLIPATNGLGATIRVGSSTESVVATHAGSTGQYYVKLTGYSKGGGGGYPALFDIDAVTVGNITAR